MQIPDHLDEIGPGWHPLLTRLHEDLLTVNPEYTVRQVKEKYGTLRVYLNTGLMRLPDLLDDPTPEHRRQDEAASRLVRAAEHRSATICEACGNPGELRHRAWLKTLCTPCSTRT